MESMSLDVRAFAFIISLAAVINGLGIVRWLTALSEHLVQQRQQDLQHYWVYSLLAAFQFLLHILMGWVMWGFRDGATINFVTYLYLLTGPVFLFLGTSALTSNIDGNGADLKRHFAEVRPIFSTVLILLWIWAIFAGPLLRGAIAPTLPLLVLFLVAAVILRATPNPKIHGAVAVINWLIMVAYISLFAMQLGGTASPAG